MGTVQILEDYSSYEVEEIKKEEAIQLLLKCARCKWSEQNLQDSKTLIKQAAGFIRSKIPAVTWYIAIYEPNKSELLRRSPLSHKTYYYEIVATAWKISIAEIEPLASDIPHLMAFMDGAKIHDNTLLVPEYSGEILKEWTEK